LSCVPTWLQVPEPVLSVGVLIVLVPTAELAMQKICCPAVTPFVWSCMLMVAGVAADPTPNCIQLDFVGSHQQTWLGVFSVAYSRPSGPGHRPCIPGLAVGGRHSRVAPFCEM
jgi:hypothetical protein